MQATLWHELGEVAICLVAIAAVGAWFLRHRGRGEEQLPPREQPLEPAGPRKVIGRIVPRGRG